MIFAGSGQVIPYPMRLCLLREFSILLTSNAHRILFLFGEGRLVHFDVQCGDNVAVCANLPIDFIILCRVIRVDGIKFAHDHLLVIHFLPQTDEELHGGQKRPLTLRNDLAPMEAECLGPKCNAECLIDKFGVPFTLAFVAGGFRVGAENARLLTRAAACSGAVLARDLLAGRARVVG